MKKEKVLPENKVFIRSFHFESPTHKVEGIFQPYLVGMYAAITDSKISSLIQLNLPHKGLDKWCKKLFTKLMKEENMKEISIDRQKYTDYITESIDTLKEFEVI